MTSAGTTSDGDILCDFYNTMPAAGKAKLTNWCGAKSGNNYVNGPCTGNGGRWLGVTCAVVGGVNRVASLDTKTPGVSALGGSLPTSFGALNALTRVDLGGNSISGSIPSSVGGLTGLTYLALSSNALTGSIPSSFCSLKTTIDLYVHTNPGLTCYPSCLSSYSKFTSNKGTLTAMCPTPENSDANVLCAFYNTVTNKAHLTNWCGSKSGNPVVYANGPCTGTGGRWYGVTCSVVGGTNRVTKLVTCSTECGMGTLDGGSLPTSIGGLDALTHLFISWAGVTGTIPTSLGALTALTYLNLGANSLTGTIPTFLAGMTKLTSLNLDVHFDPGKIPTALGGLTGLTSLSLSYLSYGGTTYNNRRPFPSFLGSLTRLARVVLSSSQLTGSIPSSLGGLTGLTYLYLDANYLTGTVPASLCSLQSTIYLNVGVNSRLTCYPSCLSTYSRFMSSKDTTLGVCATGSSFLSKITRRWRA